MKSAMLVFVIVCMMGSRTPLAAQQRLHADVADPVGDVTPSGLAPTHAPDLIAGTADVADGNLTFVVQFAAGTFDRRTNGILIYLDTDDNRSTGASMLGLGIDYMVGSNTGGIGKYKPRSQLDFEDGGSASVSFLKDAIRIVVPLKRLGNSDGRMAFRVVAYTRPRASDGAVDYVDYMPDLGRPPARLQ